MGPPLLGTLFKFGGFAFGGPGKSESASSEEEPGRFSKEDSNSLARSSRSSSETSSSGLCFVENDGGGGFSLGMSIWISESSSEDSGSSCSRG